MLLAKQPINRHWATVTSHQHTADIYLISAGAISFAYTFSKDVDALLTNPVESERFKSEVQRAFLAGVVEAWTNGPDLADTAGALRLVHAIVGPIRANANNVMIDVTLLPPPSTTPEQIAQLALLPPAELLAASSAVRKDLVSSERASASAVHDQAQQHKLLEGDAIIGVVIGAVGVVAAILAAIVVVVRRRATVHARNRIFSDDSEAQARQHLSTTGGSPASSTPHSVATLPSPHDAKTSAALNSTDTKTSRKPVSAADVRKGAAL